MLVNPSPLHRSISNPVLGARSRQLKPDPIPSLELSPSYKSLQTHNTRKRSFGSFGEDSLDLTIQKVRRTVSLRKREEKRILEGSLETELEGGNRQEFSHNLVYLKADESTALQKRVHEEYRAFFNWVKENYPIGDLSGHYEIPMTDLTPFFIRNLPDISKNTLIERVYEALCPDAFCQEGVSYLLEHRDRIENQTGDTLEEKIEVFLTKEKQRERHDLLNCLEKQRKNSGNLDIPLQYFHSEASIKELIHLLFIDYRTITTFLSFQKPQELASIRAKRLYDSLKPQLKVVSFERFKEVFQGHCKPIYEEKIKQVIYTRYSDLLYLHQFGFTSLSEYLDYEVALFEAQLDLRNQTLEDSLSQFLFVLETKFEIFDIKMASSLENYLFDLADYLENLLNKGYHPDQLTHLTSNLNRELLFGCVLIASREPSFLSRRLEEITEIQITVERFLDPYISGGRTKEKAIHRRSLELVILEKTFESLTTDEVLQISYWAYVNMAVKTYLTTKENVSYFLSTQQLTTEDIDFLFKQLEEALSTDLPKRLDPAELKKDINTCFTYIKDLHNSLFKKERQLSF